MHTRIYWFSGTGNCYWLATQLRGLLGDGDAELQSIASDEWRGSALPGRAIVMYPAFAGRLPLIVQRFLRDAPFSADTDIHLIASFALWRTGCLSVARAILAGRGLDARAAFAIKMPNNYTPFGGAAPEEKQNQMFQKAGERLPEIVQTINDPARRAWEGGSFLARFWVFANTWMIKLGAGEDRHFHSDENCDGCGLCARICPVKNIEMRSGRPVWLGHSEQCFRCLQYCPRESIQYKQSTVGRKRYHHPAVPASIWTKN